ncbi:MAG TPA: hypothetical protein VGF45_01740 [Polyangia bacterium]
MSRSIVGAALRASALLGGLVAWVVIAACTSHPLGVLPPGPEGEDNQLFPIESTKKIDLLFVIDDSGSMQEEQTSLRANFPRFMQELERGGLPDLQIAVISTDMGAGGITVDDCTGIGDGGRFQAAANCPLQAGAPPYLKIDPQGRKNFDGALTDAFSCIANLGTGGCGYEHQLQSLRVSLSNNNPHLGTFLRSDAHLGIIIISDEDDCSGDFDSTLYTGVIAGQSANLRCATAGHVCQDRPVTAMPMSVPLASCQAATHGPGDAGRRAGLLNIDTFVNHVKSLKAPGRRILVAGIYGSGTDGTYEIRGGGNGNNLDLRPKCDVDGAGTAAPGIRLRAFIDAFGADGSHHSICGADLREAMAKIGTAVAAVGADTCLQARPRDIDPATSALEVECAVYEQETAVPTAAPRLIPQCSATSSARPCWEVQNDTMCTRSQTRLIINRNGPAPDGFTVVARCAGTPTTNAGR